jgi:hypothetical protein
MWNAAFCFRFAAFVNFYATYFFIVLANFGKNHQYVYGDSCFDFDVYFVYSSSIFHH